MGKENDILGKILVYSYTLTWINAGSLYTSALVNYILENVPLSFLLSFLALNFIEKSLGSYIRHSLMKFSEISKNPLDKRLYRFFDGWTAFITAMVLLVIFEGIFKFNPPFNPGVFVYFPIVSGGIFFLTLFFCIFTKRI